MSDPTFAVVTFGCQMNRHDSERVAGVLVASGYREAADRDAADVLLFNTCCVREGAAQRLKGQVASLAGVKRARPDMIVGVLGCLAQAEGGRLVDELPHIDMVVGTHRLAELPELLEAVQAARAPVVDVGQDTRFTADLPSRRESPTRAWVAVMQGCDNHCAYCIVPAVRGPERSRPIADIACEAEALREDGVIEITLLGQNVNSYGRDLYGRPRFAELLERLDALGVPRLRFTTSHPRDLDDGLIEAIARCGSVCEHLHLPAQSGSDRVLGAMSRGYTASWYRERVAKLRSEVPDITMSTDLMVGFPGETEADFEETLTLVEEIGFGQAFTFIYSPRPGTPAVKLPLDIEPSEARDRMSRLVEAVNRQALGVNQGLVGSVQEVLVEGPAKKGDGLLKGHARGGQTVILPGGSSLPGQLVEATMVEANTWFLLGEVHPSGR